MQKIIINESLNVIDYEKINRNQAQLNNKVDMQKKIFQNNNSVPNTNTFCTNNSMPSNFSMGYAGKMRFKEYYGLKVPNDNDGWEYSDDI